MNYSDFTPEDYETFIGLKNGHSLHKDPIIYSNNIGNSHTYIGQNYNSDHINGGITVK